MPGIAQQFSAEGWSWVETRLKYDFNEIARYGRLPSVSRSCTKKEKAEFRAQEKAKETVPAAEVNLLKSNTQVVVDRRPVGVRVAGAATLPGTIFGHNEQPTPSEREALQKAVSADHLEKQGLGEGTHGEIFNERDRTVFDIGFACAIRKVLGS